MTTFVSNYVPIHTEYNTTLFEYPFDMSSRSTLYEYKFE
jgi:hypothetical protein